MARRCSSPSLTGMSNIDQGREQYGTDMRFTQRYKWSGPLGRIWRGGHGEGKGTTCFAKKTKVEK